MHASLLLFAALTAQAQLLEVGKIWDTAPHNAFTDLIRYKNAMWCVFREGAAHVSPDGSIRVLSLRDGETTWTSAAVIRSDEGDLRDPHFSITPKGELMLVAAAAHRTGTKTQHQTYAWFSKNGKSWSDATPIGDRDFWLWRIAWNDDKEAFSLGYSTTGAAPNRMYRSKDGKEFQAVGDIPNACGVSEAAIVFATDGTRYILERRDKCDKTAALWVSTSRAASEKELNASIAGPVLIELPDGKLLGAGRFTTDDRNRTSLFWLDPVNGTVKELTALPSSGDTSYPGLVFYKGILYISYYSSHEGKASIYFAKYKLP